MELAKISSKGQLVIPQNIRDKLKIEEGEILVVSTKDDLIILKKIKDPMEEDDMKTLIEIKKAWEEIESGKYKKKSSDEFLKEISRW
ncbi:MAG: AbrB/MazE/SpoVT family DNA-binding domain-containing protein [Nanoarchaeota archaeon]